MIGADLLRDAQRQLEVCNACRYCEGVCAVFPALERRRAFTAGDVGFLAHLCHDCRACYYVCPFAPPHEFGVNIPQLMSTVRTRTYDGYATPRSIARIARDRGPGLAVIVFVALIVAVGASIAFAGPSVLTTARTGPGSFYQVIPWAWMFVPATVLTALGILVAMIGLVRYWRDIGASAPGARDTPSLTRGLMDALMLRNLGGGGPGCDYPDDEPSTARRWAHHLTFYGFVATFIATVLAFLEQEVFGRLPPYDFISGPVLFGLGGGIAMIVGVVGLAILKARSDREPATTVMIARDYAFMSVLLGLSVTGILLLFLRDSPLMAVLLDVHLALVLAFYVTAPYGKFVHFVYRTAALVRDRLERHAEAAQQPG
jgi:citrate/tricarballylate utilization protein